MLNVRVPAHSEGQAHRSTPSSGPPTSGELDFDMGIEAGKIVLRLEGRMVACLGVEEESSDPYVELSRPHGLIGGVSIPKKRGTKLRKAAAAKVAALEHSISEEDVVSMVKLVKQMKRAASADGVPFPPKGNLVPNSRIARLIIAAKRAVDAVYVAQAESGEPAAAKANTRVVEIIPDSGANLEILDGRDVSEAGIGIDKTKSMGVKGVEGQFSTLGETQARLPFPLLDVDGRVDDDFGLTGQVKDGSNADGPRQHLVSVVQYLVRNGWEVTFRANSKQGVGHFMRRRGGGRLYPIHLNVDGLPILPTVGCRYTHKSTPDGLVEYARDLVKAAQSEGRKVKKTAKAAEKALMTVLSGATSSSSETASESDTASDTSTDTDDAVRHLRALESKLSGRGGKSRSAKAHKARARVIRNLLTPVKAHALLHRGVAATKAALSRPDAKIVASDGKVKAGDDPGLSEADFSHGKCETCSAVRMKAPATRSGGHVRFGAGASA